jgi:hypothetical protein
MDINKIMVLALLALSLPVRDARRRHGQGDP